METQKIIHITSGYGPAECCLAVSLALKEMLKEIKAANLHYTIIERCAGIENGTLSSASLKVEGNGADLLAESWKGSLLWIAQSPYRKWHKRKNWFIAIHVMDHNVLKPWNGQDVRYQTMRASGPGGQHVNKTETAVRATHIPSGLSVVARDSRSQWQNKKMATERLEEQFIQWQLSDVKQRTIDQWQQHQVLERGNPKRIYKNKEFKA